MVKDWVKSLPGFGHLMSITFKLLVLKSLPRGKWWSWKETGLTSAANNLSYRSTSKFRKEQGCHQMLTGGFNVVFMKLVKFVPERSAFGLTLDWPDWGASTSKRIIMEPGWDFNGALLNQITVRCARQDDQHRATADVGDVDFWRPLVFTWQE